MSDSYSVEACTSDEAVKLNGSGTLSIVLILRGNRGMNEVETGNIKQTPLRLIEPCSCRAEINPQPRESRSGQKLVIASQWVSSCNGCKSHLTKAEPAGQ